MWLMLQQEGQRERRAALSARVRSAGLRVAGIEIEWHASGANEVAVAIGGTLSGQPAKGRTLVPIDPRYLRPTEVWPRVSRT